MSDSERGTTGLYDASSSSSELSERPIESQEAPTENLCNDLANQEIDANGNYVADIWRIVPHGHETRKSFHELLVAKELDVLVQHHQQYLVQSGKTTNIPGLRDPEETADEDLDSLKEDFMMYTGYYRIAFSCKTISGDVEYKFGRGSRTKFGPSRGIDAPLALSESRASRGLGAVSVMIFLHPHSGEWMLFAEAEIELDGELLEPGQYRLLRNQTSWLKIYNKEYVIICVEMKAAYHKTRDSILARSGGDIPAINLLGTPASKTFSLPSIVFTAQGDKKRHNSNFDGLDPKGGGLRVAHRWIIQNKKQHHKVTFRADTMEAFQGVPGVPTFFGVSSNDGETNIRKVRPHSEIYTVYEKTYPFRDALDLPNDWEARKVVMKDLLACLAHLQDQGYLHRAIDPSSNAYIKNPFQAVFSDLEDLHLGSEGNMTIAEIKHYPPEVLDDQSTTYDSKVDTWMLAKTLAWYWFPKFGGNPNLRDRNEHSKLLKSLVISKMPLSKLFQRMLSWDPNDRPTAAQAVADPALRPSATPPLIATPKAKAIAEHARASKRSSSSSTNTRPIAATIAASDTAPRSSGRARRRPYWQDESYGP